jgi:hypothetical protein
MSTATAENVTQNSRNLPLFDNIPQQLKERNQWVLWKLVARGTEKPTKVPFSARSLKHAKSTDPTTWESYEMTKARLLKEPTFDGIGYMFAEDDIYTGIDIDNCFIGKSLTMLAADIMKRLDSYTEVSPSGKGVRIFVEAKKIGDRCKSVANGVEIYHKERLLTVTGRRSKAMPATINKRQAELDKLYNELWPEKVREAYAGPTEPISLSDAALIELAKNADNGDKFTKLWNGREEDLIELGYTDPQKTKADHSSADLALCDLLAFWTRRDAERIDTLFRQSKLMRPKWERDSYREPTITKAIELCGEVYTEPKATERASEEQAIHNVFNSTEATSTEWPAPIPLTPEQTKVPKFPIDVFRGIVPQVAELCEALADVMQVPVDFPATMALSILSIPMMGKVKVEIAKGVFYDPMIWSFTALESGMKKSPVVKLLREPISTWEKESLLRLTPAIAEDKRNRAIAAERAKVLTKALSSGKGDATALLQDLKNVEKELAKPPVTAPRWLISDTTPEAAMSMMVRNGGKCAVVDDEATFLSNMAGRYSNNPNYELCLKAWSGDDYTVDRKTGDSFIIENARMVVAIAAQPIVLEALVSDKIARDSGFLPRFLLCYPEDMRGHRVDKSNVPLPEAPLKAWRAILERLLNQTESIQLTQHPEGRQLKTKLIDEWEPRVKTAGSFGQIAAWADKGREAQLVRLSAILHLASGNTDTEIPPATMAAAVSLIKYYSVHALKAYGISDASPLLEPASKILAMIRAKGWNEFKPNDLKDIRAFRIDKELRNDCLELLICYGYLRQVSAVDCRNRPQSVYAVNPRLER